MKSLRTIAVAGVVGAASFASSLCSGLFGGTDSQANAQSLARTPSVLAASANSANGYRVAANYAMPGYQAMTNPYAAPAYNGQPMAGAMPYGYAAYPSNPYAAQAYPALYPQQQAYPFNQVSTQPTWPFVQATDGQASVVLGRSELLAGPPLSSPQVQVPVPANGQQQSHGHTHQLPQPGQQMQTMQTAPMQGPVMQGPVMMGQPMQGYAMPGYGMEGYGYGAYGGGAGCDVWSDGYAAMYGQSAQPAASTWFASGSALYMTRDRGDHYTFSYGTGNEADQRTNSRDAAMGWEYGFDVRFGRYFNCGRNAIEAVYWQLNPESQTTQTVSADVLGQLNGILNWNSLTYNGNTADVYVNVAPADDGVHRLTRNFDFRNIELNLWRFCGTCDSGKCSCSKLRSNWLMGVRYFRFDENLLFASDANDLFITGEDDEIFYNIDLENHLIGFQLGNEAQYCVSDRLTADLGIKLGVYANQINHVSEIGGTLGVATINNGPFLNEPYNINSNKTDIAFLGEFDFGLRYCMSCHWTGTFGYRALAVSGVAMSSDQIYPDLRGINDVENIDSSRAMILHGGYAGLEYTW